MKSVFVSYVHEDFAWRDRAIEWIRSGQIGNGFTSTVERGDFRPLGEEAIKEHLRPLIRGAAVVLCIVGSDTHNHAWVRYELSVAASLGKQIVFARIPSTTGAHPPGFTQLPEVALTPTALAKKFAEL